jgi:hypothetical protein
MRYELFVGCVDGDTYWTAESSEFKPLLDLLEKFDHEGSTVSLDVKSDDGSERIKEISDPEHVYSVLKGGKL